MLKTSTRLTSIQKIFLAELAGTFVVVLLATSSVVIDAQAGVGLWFVAFAPFAAVAAMVYAFGSISMAHFNPAVTLAFFITGHTKKSQLPVYLGAEIAGALLASLFLVIFVGTANLGANAPDYSFSVPFIFGIEVLATAFLIAMIMFVVYKKTPRWLGAPAIGSIIGLDIFFLSFISGASMNPARSLAPALLSGAVGDLWLYWTATFAGSAIVALLFKKLQR